MCQVQSHLICGQDVIARLIERRSRRSTNSEAAAIVSVSPSRAAGENVPTALMCVHVAIHSRRSTGSLAVVAVTIYRRWLRRRETLSTARAETHRSIASHERRLRVS